jgi:GNAT superfamily N-acetyltransferase
MRYTDDVPGMVLAPMPPPAPDAAPVEIVPVRDERDCATGAQVLAAAFGMPPAASGQLFSSRLAGAHDVRAYVGRIDGAIVATSMLIAAGGVAGVWAVATLDAYRGRGIGAAMTRHAVDEGARLGCTSACLQASEMGQPVYERMGFRTVAQYRTYVQKEVWEKMQR